jgi:hypothetical protein
VPHVAIYNSWLLEKYFIKHNLSPSSSTTIHFNYFPDYPSIATEMNMHKVFPSKKRLMVYSRPHIDRNAFDFTVACLWKAVEQGVINPDEWTIVGIGGPSEMSNVGNLGNNPNAIMYNIGHVHDDTYKALIKTGDVGLCLMFTPHPSLPPFDFASAGMLVVTNEMFERTGIEYNSISHNFFPSRATIASVVSKLSQAIDKCSDIKYRQEGSYLNIPDHFVDFSYLSNLLHQ